MYSEQPPGVLGSVVWERAARTERTTHRVLPDGCMDVIWHGELLVAGPDSRAVLAAGTPGRGFTGLRLPPGVGRAVFGVPACELRDRRVRLEDVWSAAEVRELSERLASAASPGARAELLETAVVRHHRAEARGGGAPRAGHAPERLRRLILAGVTEASPVTRIADSAGLSERQLRRWCLDLFGYGPRTLARVLRLRRAVALLDDGLPLADVAARAGYADQPHFSREVGRLAGVPPGSLRPPAPRRVPS